MSIKEDESPKPKATQGKDAGVIENEKEPEQAKQPSPRKRRLTPPRPKSPQRVDRNAINKKAFPRLEATTAPDKSKEPASRATPVSQVPPPPLSKKAKSQQQLKFQVNKGTLEKPAI